MILVIKYYFNKDALNETICSVGNNNYFVHENEHSVM